MHEAAAALVPRSTLPGQVPKARLRHNVRRFSAIDHVGKYHASIGELMKAGAMDFKDASGRTLREDLNQAVGRAAGGVLTGTGIQESDANTIKSGMQRRSQSGEASTKRASRTAQNQRSGTVGDGGAGSRVARKTLLGDS